MEVLTSRTIIRPSDLDRSLTFYGDALGLAVAREFGAGAQRGVVYFAGGGLIEVVGTNTTPAGTGPVALWLQVRNVDETLAELVGRGVGVSRPAVLEPWGLIEAWIHDPDGVRIHLVEVPADHPLRRDMRTPLTGADQQ
ncbi:MAG TPA: VOC family protein [Acidimicrobiales bacterium]|jgi:predicted enzyme related to lactoylglutathione lyase|nr:VOC family protein [Acidimicrobiales bacterium]